MNRSNISLLVLLVVLTIFVGCSGKPQSFSFRFNSATNCVLSGTEEIDNLSREVTINSPTNITITARKYSLSLTSKTPQIPCEIIYESPRKTASPSEPDMTGMKKTLDNNYPGMEFSFKSRAANGYSARMVTRSKR